MGFVLILGATERQPGMLADRHTHTGIQHI